MKPPAYPPAPLKKQVLQDAVRHRLKYDFAKNWEERSRRDVFQSVALTVRDRLVEGMLATEARYRKEDVKRLYYLSIEFLIGRSLSNNLLNLGLFESCREGLAEMGIDFEEIQAEESDAGLGNGGLGRLAACFLDSLATLGLPGFGYGIHYEYGLFKQEIQDGSQVEKPDYWIPSAGSLQIERPDEACMVLLYGRVEPAENLAGNYNPIWLDWEEIIGVPYDIPIAGFGGDTVNYLRLYAARPSSGFDIGIFNEGDYIRAVERKIYSENVSKILYPSDSVDTGRELRLIQEYFLVACSLRDIVRRFCRRHSSFDQFSHQVAIQLNDTHPALAVAELMRILVDENNLPWERAWDLTRSTLAFTNHTLLPEAMEKWPVDLLARVLPRHLQIIFEINRRFLEQVTARCTLDAELLRRVSLVEEGPAKLIRMAHLAVVGSHAVNGVSALHTELLKQNVFRDFYRMWPERFHNKTNGITPRRWLLKANPELAGLISCAIGDAWITDLDQLRQLEPFAGDGPFQEEFRQIKRANKERLGHLIYDSTRVRVNPDALFDVQAKRIHEYKRQLLNVIHIIHTYLALVEDGLEPTVPKVHVFAGKAAPGYWAAKQIIKLINYVGEVVNRDARVKDWLQVVFVPDYRVTLAEQLIGAADLSEQISTAGKEASGTGNMKFALNGALTIGTLDGANIEIKEEVGQDNIYIFGLTADDIAEMRRQSSYHPRAYYQNYPDLRRVLDSLRDGPFNLGEPGLFSWIFDSLVHQGDPYFLLADFPSYREAQARAGREFQDQALWSQKAILNVARMGKFSSDRSIKEYAREIWRLDQGS
ncbi:MAG: glycogen/starch/alpha-glucan phosphorylase [Thermodesulfobacteriota bacterium]